MGHPATSPAQPAAEGGETLPGDLLMPELGELLKGRQSIRERAAPPAEPAGSSPEHATGPLLHFARGTSARSSAIEAQREMTFAQLVQELQSHFHVGKLPLSEYLRLKSGTAAGKARAARDKDGAWWSPWSYAAPTRNAANARAGSAIVLDFDGGMLTAEQVSAPLAQITHVRHTTYSHSPEHPKYRAVIPLSRSISRQEHKRLLEYFVSLYLEGAVDSSTKDDCRLWFYPGAAADMAQHREFDVIEGAGFCDVDATLSALRGADSAPPSELPSAFAAASPIVVSGPHPNDALAYSAEHRKLTADDVRRMLACVAIPDAPGQRRGRWLKVLQAVHDWSNGSEEAFGLIDAWSATQPSYVGSDDVRKIWDSCRGHGITIASVVAMALEGGFSFEPAAEEDSVDEVIPADGVPESARVSSAIRDLRARIDACIGSGDTKQVAALRVLEEDLVFVADQQAYRSLSDGLFLNPYSIRQKLKAAMPRGVNGQRLDPCKLLENSVSKCVVSALDYHPGEQQIFARGDGRLKLNDYARPPGPWRLPADSHVRHTVARLLAHVLLDPADASRLADKYAFLLQRMGAGSRMRPS